MDFWPKKIQKIYRSFWLLYKLLEYPPQQDKKEAYYGLIQGFLKNCPQAPNSLIAEKILILLKDIMKMPQEQLPSINTLRQEISRLRKV